MFDKIISVDRAATGSGCKGFHLRGKQRLGPVQIAARPGVPATTHVQPVTVHVVLVRCQTPIARLTSLVGDHIPLYSATNEVAEYGDSAD